MKTKTLIDGSIAEKYFTSCKIFAFSFLRWGDKYGGRCWQYAVFKINSEIHILEIAFDEDGESHWVLGVVNY